MHKGFGIAAAAALTAVVGTAHAADKLKIGVTATLEGTYTSSARTACAATNSR
jgi:hypothetical protein